MSKIKFHNPRHMVMIGKNSVSGGSMISIKTKPITSTDVKVPEAASAPTPAPVTAVITGNGLDLIKFPKQVNKKKITLSLK